MKQAFWFLCAILVLTLATGALSSVKAQTSSPTPDPFVVQLTRNPSGFFNAFAQDMTANGRFIVFESNGDVATEKTPTRNNADGNREIFLADYAQRRIFQITDTKNVLKTPTTPSPTPTPTPTASPTPTPLPTPADLTQVKIEILNNWAMISAAPPLGVDGKRVYTIVFSSNAPDPKLFDGTEGTLQADGNKEIWIYQFAAADVDLTLGTDFYEDLLNLAGFKRITDTPASRVPSPGSTSASPVIADDNREPSISDDGRFLAFISTRDLVPGVGNTDENPELFFYVIATGTPVQGTKTQDATKGVGLVFQQNPTLSADGSVVSFYSSADLAGQNNDGNAEIYVAKFSGSAMTEIKQVTRTQSDSTTGRNVNILAPGRRMSRDGSMIAFESLATDPKANATTNNNTLVMFVYSVASDTFAQIGQRPSFVDINHFPAFTDYDPITGAPKSLVFASAANFRPDGTFPTAAQASEGLNPFGTAQIFLTQLPASSSNTFIRLTNNPNFTSFGGTRPMTSSTRTRMAFSFGGAELGTGNTDLSIELFYLLTPQITAESSAVLSFFTGASAVPVPAATPLPSPTPTPTPTPSPSPGAAIGLAPGELSIVRSTVALAPSNAELVCVDPARPCASETKRSPALPVELNGVSVSVNGAAAGLYFVSNSDKQINFVMPPGVAPGVGRVVVNVLDTGANTDTVHRGFVQIVAGQPDIFTFPGNRAAATNVTNPKVRTLEPFSVTSPNESGTSVATVLELMVTGVRLATTSEISVAVGSATIGTSDILFVGPNPEMPGTDLINFRVPASLAGATDVPVIVTFTRSGVSVTSRSADSAPKITFNP